MNVYTVPKHKYSGARSLILLHELKLNSFYNTWKEANRLNVKLPKTDDTDYESLGTLLKHVLRSSGGYLRWICDKLELTSPYILDIPIEVSDTDTIEQYIKHLVNEWKTPLANIKEEKFHFPEYTSNWGVKYCIEAMLEHAVMHPVRHDFQLKNLINSVN